MSEPLFFLPENRNLSRERFRTIFTRYADKDKDEDNKAYINSRQIEILIKIQYFQEFGNNKKLLTIYDAFKMLYGRKVIPKDKISEFPIPEVLLKNIPSTEKQYRIEDMDSILKYIENNTPNESLSIKEQVEFEYENLGYINMTYDVDKRMCYVLDVDTKYRPKVTLYCLNNAKQVDCKIYKEVFDKNLLKKGDIIRAGNFQRKEKVRKTENGWEKTGEKEWLLNDYKKITEGEIYDRI